MRLIDADALKKRVDEVFFNDEVEFKDLIDNAPTVAEVFKIGSATGLRLVIDDAPTVEPACWDCEHFGEKAVTGHCIKCRDKDMWEMKKGGAE